MNVRARAAMGFLALGVGYGLAWTALPLHLPVMCPFRLVTGYPCPACGLTHAACALAHGQVLAAEHFNVAAVPLAGLAALVAVGLAAELWTNRPWLAGAWRRGKRGLGIGIVGLMGVAWVFHFVALPV